jgi:hypothetical protein
VARGPVFIVGAMGSGTTLLRLMLDSHPSIAIPHETGFMRSYNAQLFAPFKHSGDRWAQRLGFTDEEYDELLREFYDRLFMRYAESHGKQRWGEKTPLHTWHIESMARVFPDAQVIGVLRHPFGSVASNTRRFKAEMPKHARHWDSYTRELASQAIAHPDRLRLLRYEELVQHPEPVLRELLEWLGEPWSDSVLEHHAVQAARGGDGRVEGKSRSDEPIDTTRVDKWTRLLDDEDQRWLGKRLGRLAGFYGYSVEDPADLEPLAEPGSWLIRADDIERRTARFPDLGLPAPGKPSPFERPYDPRRVTLVRARKKGSRTPPPAAANGSADLVLRRLAARARDRVLPRLRRARAAVGRRR